MERTASLTGGMAVLNGDTIAALATATGEAAVAIVRISGPSAIAIFFKVFSPCTSEEVAPRRLLYGTIRNPEGILLDRGLGVVFRTPKSYTGEDMVELHCHGGMFVSASVLDAVLAAGARAAEPGEFTLRAFLNGKMDLTQAEAVMDVIRARTPLALAAAEAQLQGHLGQTLAILRKELLDLVARIEAFVDFPEEGLPEIDAMEFRTRIENTLTQVSAWIATANEGRILREGVRIALCGAPNVGKSSLLNRLLGSDRAIVTPIAGTTRDTIEESLVLRGLLCRITDTAGLRDTNDTIESLGIERTHAVVAEADIVIRIFDAGNLQDGISIPLARGEKEIFVVNKSDLLTSGLAVPASAIAISCQTGEGISSLCDAIVARTGITRPSGIAISARHLACLRRAQEGLQATLEEIHHSPEYIAQGLHDALDAVGEVLGLADSEEILGEIFAKFCIGK